jgi:hypothetical protein
MRRELNELEYFTWCIGQPYNLVVAVHLRGDLGPDRLRAALDKVQRRHPLLNVNVDVGPDGRPAFSSDGVGAIPLAVVDAAEPDETLRLVETELASPFALGATAPEAPRLPLLRVSLLLPREPARATAVVLTAQHVVADGLSLVFLVRDLLRFLEEPDAPVTVLDAPASAADLLPARVRRRLPTSSRRFRLALWLAWAWVRLRFGGPAASPQRRTQHHRSWQLTPDETSRLRARCRREGVSVQSAICTAFLPGFPSIQMPVNLRPLLARPVGESVGFYVGAAQLELKWREGPGFWGNARRVHRRLRRALRDPFRLYRLFSKAVPAEAVRELLGLLVTIVTRQRPFSVTNLGELDRGGVKLHGRQLVLESMFGAVTSTVDASVLTVYTIDDSLRLHVLANEPSPSETVIRDELARGVSRLLEAIE